MVIVVVIVSGRTASGSAVQAQWPSEISILVFFILPVLVMPVSFPGVLAEAAQGGGDSAALTRPVWLVPLEQQQHDGFVHRWSASKGRGFIRNDEILRLTGYDVRFAGVQLAPSDLVLGARIQFQVEFDGALRPRVKGVASGGLSVDSCRGFIHNEALHRLLGKDVLFRAVQVPGAQVGQSVCFHLELDAEGRPRVKEALEGTLNTKGPVKKRQALGG
ncbi:hypothetical protein AK812_SmicGene5918 [Symbiodinium microadriaticum]|uniref:Uncharacterized protein n=1 Tax=Symbiodinium microadriaticum TaxID=2951 RepID=A0A1Q9ESK8_SYMMI|nr:hypothetical protein AK812_SmicGene5918 [Symbiodinium microadriaticum]